MAQSGHARLTDQCPLLVGKADIAAADVFLAHSIPENFAVIFFREVPKSFKENWMRLLPARANANKFTSRLRFRRRS
jgi:hypothetical protein